MTPVRLGFLTPERGFIFRITHIKNVPWILDHGLHCASSSVQDPNYVPIGNPDLIEKRAQREVPAPPGGTLSDYVPFYFTPLTPMLLNIKTGWKGIKMTPMPDIAILVTSVHRIAERGVRLLLVDRHAYLTAARFSSDLASLADLDWTRLQASDFKHRPDDPEPFERYQAEALVYKHLPVEHLDRIVCYDAVQQRLLTLELTSRRLAIDLAAEPSWYC